MAVNVKLLKKVRKLIAEEPRRLRMSVWGKKVTGRNAPPCGTVACLAGWTVIAARPHYMKFTGKLDDLVMKNNGGVDTPQLAQRLLGLDTSYPFFEVSWTVRDVLSWIDHQIDAAEGR